MEHSKPCYRQLHTLKDPLCCRTELDMFGDWDPRPGIWHLAGLLTDYSQLQPWGWQRLLLWTSFVAPELQCGYKDWLHLSSHQPFLNCPKYWKPSLKDLILKRRYTRLCLITAPTPSVSHGDMSTFVKKQQPQNPPAISLGLEIPFQVSKANFISVANEYEQQILSQSFFLAFPPSWHLAHTVCFQHVSLHTQIYSKRKCCIFIHVCNWSIYSSTNDSTC